jgi:hypothetical protein
MVFAYLIISVEYADLCYLSVFFNEEGNDYLKRDRISHFSCRIRNEVKLNTSSVYASEEGIFKERPSMLFRDEKIILWRRVSNSVHALVIERTESLMLAQQALLQCAALIGELGNEEAWVSAPEEPLRLLHVFFPSSLLPFYNQSALKALKLRPDA